MITILGPTATGKTRFAAHLAYQLNGEIISADSRQVYREMNIGSGKDYSDYIVCGSRIPCHLIDIAEPGSEYNVYLYQKDFLKVYSEIRQRGKLPLMCGGSGLYIEAVLMGYKLIEVPENKALRRALDKKTDEELISILARLKPLHNTSDTSTRKRTMRAIEIQMYTCSHPELSPSFPKIKTMVFGLHFQREQIRERITARLLKRLKNGMVEEVHALLEKGIRPEQLKRYGLEYKYITQHLISELSYDEMVSKLNTAIHRFAKRQLTWFRRMERNGTVIHWIDGSLPMEDKTRQVLELLETKSKNIIGG